MEMLTISLLVCGVILVFSFIFTLRCSVIRKKNLEYMCGIDAFVGKHVVVIAPITHDVPGRVRLYGQIWFALSAAHHDEFSIGQMVKIVRVEGAHLIVVKS